MQPQEQHDELVLAKLLATADKGAPPVDRAALDRLRQSASAAFLAARPEPVQLAKRNYSMFAIRSLIAAAALSVVAGLAMFSNLAARHNQRTLGFALQQAAQAHSLHFNLTLASLSGEGWATRPHRMRWDLPDGTYQIAAGGRLWLVDERANQASSSPSPYFQDSAAGLDPLALLGVPEEQREEIRTARPIEQVEHDGVKLDVYRITYPSASEGTLELEAVVETAGRQLRQVATREIRAGKRQPVAELQFVAFNAPVDEEKFVVSETLTEDGRVGKITDVQGIVSLRPALQQRWTPVCGSMLLKPGDQVRTDLRGANAVALKFVKDKIITLGPGTLVEVVSPKQVRLLAGELAVSTDEKESFEVLGPAGQKVAVAGKDFFRLDAKEKVVAVDKPPKWYQGFSGSIVQESIGSLVAMSKVDGRNVPLTVGYHKVSVEIRDQIARTTIEESFQNRTKEVLEGVFYFPLPQDASISGFGMWIGDTLVEADVVEKERAREIYETILREKRDPGLLEWTGGNLFKARVYPIPAQGEKRIKITYTQVLPLKGNRCRYSYALQSEMLKQHPLRQLDIDVKLHSAVPLAAVASPTHETRTQSTKHSAQLSFTAKEYTPTRDFEVTFDVDRGASDVVLIPHRRGDDGYFLLLLNAPAAGGAWQRDVLPDGEPLDLLVLADTSASMDARQRAAQGDFVAALLASLTPKDKFNLAACDVECDLVFEQQTAAEPKQVAAAREFLARRRSLGWTDLDKAFAVATKKCTPKTQIIYIGDGVVTTGDADPVAFAQRLRREYHHKAGTFHAVTVGSSFEPLVVKAIAAQGGGSVRRVAGEKTPAAVALELLSEISQPGLRDVQVSFAGLRTARVYPEELPNLAAGTQQVILGRYLPQGTDQQGKVVVNGTQNGKPVRYSADVSLADAESGNSFIPRLWARMHLDTLLEQGASGVIKEEVIALSEEFHIITPYTSLLVLETDADRERFKVQRRFQMRDGEKFFAEGRNLANYDLVQQQMRRAGAWRVGLRRSVLAELATLGRNVNLFNPRQPYDRFGVHSRRFSSLSSGLARLGDGREDFYYFGTPSNGPEDAGVAADFDGLRDVWHSTANPTTWAIADREMDERLGELSLNEAASETSTDGTFFAEDSPNEASFEKLKSEKSNADFKQLLEFEVPLQDRLDLPAGETGLGYGLMQDYEADGNGVSTGMGLGIAGFGRGGFGYQLYDRKGHGYRNRYNYTDWVNTLFPQLPSAPRTKKAKEPEPTWPAEARALAASLLRAEKIAAMKEGLDIFRTIDHFDPRWNEVTNRATQRELVSTTAWLVRSQAQASQTLVNWCDAKERGVYSRAFALGRRRASVPEELKSLPLSLPDYSLISLEQSYRGYVPKIEPQGEGRTLLTLSAKRNVRYEIRFLIDTARHVILSIEERKQGKVSSTTKFDDFVEVGGTWWARQIETFNAEGRRTSLTTQSVAAVALDAFAEQLKAEFAGREQVQFISLPSVKVTAAKKALAAGKATFDDHLALLLHFAGSQQWTKVSEQLEACEKAAAGKPGLIWVRDAVLNIARRHEELRQRLVKRAADGAVAGAVGNALRGVPGSSESEAYFLANYLYQQAAGVCESNETFAILESLKPLFEKQPPHLAAFKYWRQQRLGYLQNTERVDDALAMRKELAVDYPRDESLQREYATALVAQGDYPAAYAWLEASLNPDRKWTGYEEDNLRNAHAHLLDQQGRWVELAEYLANWVKLNPETRGPYLYYLSALVRTDKVAQADALLAEWLKAGQQAGELPPSVAARLSAAVSHALGQWHNMHTNQIEEKWLVPLADVAIFFAQHETQYGNAQQIMNHQTFRASDQARRVRRAALDLLKAEAAKLTPEQLERLIGWVEMNDPVVEAPVWKQLTDLLVARWKAETDLETKHRLSSPIFRLLNHVGSAEKLAFARRQIAEGPAEYKQAYIQQLWNLLLEQPYSPEIENEAFALLTRLGNDDAEPGDRLWAHVAALHSLVDRLLAARQEAALAKVEHQEKLTRKELADKKAEILKAARTAVADRLAKETANREPALARWFTAERLYLETLLDRDLAKIAAEHWQLLGPEPVAAPVGNALRGVPESVEPDRAAALELALRGRTLIALLNLATRKVGWDSRPVQEKDKTKPKADGSEDPSYIAPNAKRLLVFLDKAQAIESLSASARQAKYRLFIALDRPKDLETALKTWARSEEQPNRWRVSLGYLLAELGRLAEAVTLFEQVEAEDELGPAEHRVLAGWYLALDRKADHERALIAAYKTTDEYRLQRRLNALLRPWQNREGKSPDRLDDEVLRLFAVLFEKSATPGNYLYLLQQYYASTRDFRLLAGLADATVGHTAAQVYPFLSTMQGVLSEIRDEATADELLARVAEIRKLAKTTIDQRAVDLLELQVERRAAEVKNQPGPHAAKALAALVRAGKREWSPGEPRLMADFLAGLEKISRSELAQEQLRQLEMLHAAAEKGSFDRLHIGRRRADTMYAYGRYDDAIALLTASLAEYLERFDGLLPAQADSHFTRLIFYLESTNHYREAETMLLAHLKRPANRQQSFWLTQKLYELYQDAIGQDAAVSMGKGVALYRAVEPKLIGELATGDQNHRAALLQRLCGVYRTAYYKKHPGVLADLQAFASKRMPELLAVQTNSYDNLVSNVGSTLYELDPKAGLAFIIERMENEPAWFRRAGRAGWNQHSGQLGSWREGVKDLGELDARLLKLVLAEVKRDLATQQSRSRVMYHSRQGYYWAAKEADYAKAAEEVLAQRGKSGAAVKYIADYLYHGVNRQNRAIEALLTAHKQELLDEGGQERLVNFLQEQDRFGESAAIAEPLVKLRPDNMNYRVWLLRAYFKSQRPNDLLALLKATDEHFHQENRWGESPLAALAASCLDNQLFEQSAAYYKELIPLHERTHPGRGIGNGTLSGYYGNQARAYAGLGKMAEAVEAAMGAIVSWGPRHDQRAGALLALQGVLSSSPDLPAYIKLLDKQTAESHQENPIVRNALGQVLMAKEKYAEAIVQLQLAVAVQPNDAETHQALIACYDKLQDKAGAVNQTFASLELNRRDLKLYEQLGDRYTALEQPKEAERAYTSLVEALPNETEGHTALAEIRQKQNRWPEAILHWQQVARLRSLEPTGLVKVAAAQLHEKQFEAAGQTLKKLRSRNWPSRFDQLPKQMQELEEQLKRGK